MDEYLGNMKEALVEVWRSVDRLGAASVGWSGRYMVSSELFVRDCVLCKVFRKCLDGIWPDHCKRSAKKEGLGGALLGYIY